MKNYCVIMEAFPNDLVAKVNARMKLGWMPVGGVSSTDTGYFLQAMVKPMDEEEWLWTTTAEVNIEEAA